MSVDSEQDLPQSWRAQWIEPVEISSNQDVQRPAYYLAGEFTIDGRVITATLFATAHGLYEVFLNGSRVGNIELTPGFTAYRKRLQVHVFNVLDLLAEGPNALGAILSDGWWRGQHGIVRRCNAYGDRTAFLAELHVQYKSGERAVIGTDDTWLSHPSHIVGADLIAGEVHDLRQYIDGWCRAGSDRSGWHNVVVVEHGFDQLCRVIGPPVRRVEEIRARAIDEIQAGVYVVDFGRNINGWVRLTNLGAEGNEVTVTYGEWLDSTGDVTQENVAYSAFAPERGAELPFQTDHVISAGDGREFEPRHSTKGFRFVRVRGCPETLTPESIRGVVVHTDLQRIGTFSCSNDALNELHQAAVWTFLANACEIPTDCPTRERSGWTGDWQLYVATAAELFDVVDWSSKWLHDLAADQLETGAVTSIVPDPSPDAPIWRECHASAGWGDAAVHVPWEVYRASGRLDILSEHFDAMCKWVDFAAAVARDGRHPVRVKRAREPLPHEEYIWDSGWQFGEWLEPGVNIEQALPALIDEDHGALATAYLYRSARELAEIAGILGEAEIAARYRELAHNILDAWRIEFIDEDGLVQPQNQPNLVRALAFGLIPLELRPRAVADLVAQIRRAGDQIGTGFLSTPFILPVLADNGHSDLAYQLLLREQYPSWLYMTRSTSSIWEEWDALRADGTVSNSLNHYSKGAVISFLHRYTAGVQIVEPGYQRFRIAPEPGGGIESATYHHDLPAGRIKVSWHIDGEDGVIDCSVPEGTEAELRLPDGYSETLRSGSYTRQWTRRSRS